MRNLKKVLSLTLALVMMLGMMTFAGAAEAKKMTLDDFKDKADITKVDAVRLMVDLGILGGDENGNFAPKAAIERAAMAKLVYTAKMGTADAANLAGAGKFTDVAANHWASGYINYCASTKIIAGVTEVTFQPSAKVTTAAAAKMLLVALGYDAAHQGYVGNSWAVSAMRDANKLGMLEGVDQTANQDLTRENAAQMLYNALNTLTVFNKLGYKFDGTSYVTETVENKTTLGYEAYHMIKVEAVVDSITEGKANLTTSTVGVVKNYDGMLPATADMAGNKVTFFVEGKVDAAGAITETGKLISTALMATPFTLLGTSTDGTVVADTSFVVGTDSDLTTKNSKNDTYIAELQENATDAAKYAVKVFVNGAEESVANTTKSAFALGSLATAAVAKSGSVVELLDADKDGKADIIRVTLKEVTKLPKVETKVEDKKDMIKIGGLTGNKFVEASTVTGYADMKKDDIVLVYTVGGVLNIEKAASVEGKIEAKKNSSTIVVGGKEYKKTGLTGINGGALPAADLALNFSGVEFKDTYVFYLDNNKNIVTNTKITEEAAKKVAVVLEFGKTGSNLDIGGSFTYRAKLMLEDGTTIIPNITKWDGVAITESATDVDYGTELNIATNKNVFVTYKIDAKGNYELTKQADAPADKLVVTPILKTAAINGNQAVFATKDPSGTIVGNSKTIFLVKSGTGDKETFKVYTGIANLPSVTALQLNQGTNHEAGWALVKDGVATHAYINATKTADAVSDKTIAYVADETKFSDVPNAADAGVTDHVLEVIIKGEKTTIRTDDDGKTAIEGVITGNGLISFVTEGGLVTANSAVAAVTTSTGITSAAGDVLVLDAANNADAAGAKSVFTYDKDTVVYVMNLDGTVATVTGDDIAADADDLVAVYRVSGTAGKTDLAETVYIVKCKSPLNAFTGVEVYVNGQKQLADAFTVVPTKTLATIKSVTEGSVVTLKLTGVSEGATYTVSTKTLGVQEDNTTLVFNDIVVTSETGVAASPATFTLTMTATPTAP